MKFKPNRQTIITAIVIFAMILLNYTMIVSILKLNKLDRAIGELTRAAQSGDPSQTDFRGTAPDEPNGEAGTFGGSEPIYIMFEYGGMIGIFDFTTGELCGVLEVHVSTLPRRDRNLLSEGIEICSNNELLSRIEDYTG